MNKKALIIVGIIVGLFVATGGVFAYTTSQADQEKMSMKKEADDAAMMKKDEEAKTMQKEDTDTAMKEDEEAKMSAGDSMEKTDDAMTR